jgi:hypothetical protein
MAKSKSLSPQRALDYCYLADLVRNSKLTVIFKQRVTIHKVHCLQPGPGVSLEKQTIEEFWYREKQIGSGGFGRIWLESSDLADGGRIYRAVKELEIRSTSLSQQAAAEPEQALSKQYLRELEAIARFSQDEVRTKTNRSLYLGIN